MQPATVSEGGAPEGIVAPRYRVVTLALVALVSIVAFEAMAISTAMPRAAVDLDAVGSYGLAFSVMLTLQLLGNVVSGVLCDRYGPMPSTYVGQLLFALGCVVCASATSFPVFLLGRGLAGLGGGLLVVALYVVVGRFYPDSLRAKIFTAISAAWVLPSLLGPVVSAWLTTTWSWRAVFWVVVVPVTASAVAIHRQRSRLDGADEGVGTASRDRRAHVRAAWLGLAVAAAAGALQWGTDELRLAWSAQTVTGLVGALAVAVVAPALLPPGTFRLRRGVASVVLARLLMPAAYFGSTTYLPLMLVRERGHSLATAGLIMSIGALGWSFGSWVQGLDRMDGRRHRLVSAGGSGLCAALLAMAALAVAGGPTWAFALPMVLAGLGMGLATSSTSVLALDLTETRDHGEAATALTIGDVLGGVLGIAAAGAVLALGRDSGWAAASGYATGWALLSAVAALVVVAGTRIVQRART